MIRQKPFGFSGLIGPVSFTKDLDEKWEQDGIFFSIKNNIFEVNFYTKEEKEKALSIANLFIQALSFQYNTKIFVNFNHSWKPKDNGGIAHSKNLNDGITIHAKYTHTFTFAIGAIARIINRSNSPSFSINQLLVEKCLKDEDLKKALGFYSEEVVDDKRPLYGIYKALEVLIEKLKINGRKKDGMEVLGNLAGKNRKYVEEVIETTQGQRHAKTLARKLLNESECRNRAKILIESYANSI